MFPDRVMSCKLVLGENVLFRRSLTSIGALSSLVVKLTGISLKKHSWDLFLAKCSMLLERWGSLQRGLFPAKMLICMSFPPLMLPSNSPLGLAPYSSITWLFGLTDWVYWTYSLGSGNYPGSGRSQETYTSKWISIWSPHIEFAWFIPYYTKLDVAARLWSQMLHSTEGLTLNFGYIANLYSSMGFLSCCDISVTFVPPLGFIGKWTRL